jgi:hypothetical protein
MLYDRTFMTIKEPLGISASPIRLQNPHFWATLVHLAEIAPLLAPRRWFIRYGDADTEAQLQLARQLQTIEEYSRARLSYPARTYRTERDMLKERMGSEPGNSTFLELVMGFSEDMDQLCEKSQRFQEMFQQDKEVARLDTCLFARPEEMMCHTPLNQRLFVANFDLCQWFTLSLLRLEPEQLDQIGKQAVLGISIAAFQMICNSLDLQKQEQLQILTFGLQYLAQYWEISVEELRADPAAPRRVNALAQLETRAKNAAARRYSNLPWVSPGRQWLNEHCQTNGFFFPESFWMQYHWFNSCIGLDLITEIALVDALALAGND